jgi:hypothetical protein
MLIPEEKPYLSGLNSYYLHIDKFVEHLQGEIGSGCLYCQSADREVLVYFDEREIIRAVLQKNGERARVAQDLTPVLRALSQTNYLITVYFLEANAIFFWGQMPPFKRAQAGLRSMDIRLPDLLFRLNTKKFYGFIQVKLMGKNGRALLFLHKGKRIGGSYSWGKGGLDPSDNNYNKLLKLLQSTPAVFAIAHFLPEEQVVLGPQHTDHSPDIIPPGAAVPTSELDLALEEFLHHFITLARKKTKSEPIVLLKQEFINRLDIYPFLDPFKSIFDYVDGRVHCSMEVPREKIAAGVIDCVWNVVRENKLEKKFRKVIGDWDSKTILKDCNIVVER